MLVSPYPAASFFFAGSLEDLPQFFVDLPQPLFLHLDLLPVIGHKAIRLIFDVGYLRIY